MDVMPSSSNSRESISLLGQDHQEYGSFKEVRLNRGRTVCTMSIGAAAETPSLRTKGGNGSLNEDALYATDDGARLLLAVADAHYGRESSHHLIQEIERLSAAIPESPDQLNALLRQIRPGAETQSSATTLMIAIYDRSARQGFGLSFGDSSLAIVGKEGARIVNLYSRRYLAPSRENGMRWDDATPFVFFTAPNTLLLAFSDGVNECHYRSPRTSVGEAHLHSLFKETGPQPDLYARRLTRLALDGVDGNPGGEDNLCLAVSLS